MVSVRINGDESGVNSSRLQKLSELIELIKSTIDPDHMITAIRVDGRELEEADWTANLSQYGTAIIEFETGTPESFVADRLHSAADIVRTCYNEFRTARKSFQAGEMLEGNQRLVGAVGTAKAFFDWYATLLQLIPDEKKAPYDINPQVEEIAEVCKRICTQQLYQSWWALGETLEKELEPRLDKLEDFCRNFRRNLA